MLVYQRVSLEPVRLSPVNPSQKVLFLRNSPPESFSQMWFGSSSSFPDIWTYIYICTLHLSICLSICRSIYIYLIYLSALFFTHFGYFCFLNLALKKSAQLHPTAPPAKDSQRSAVLLGGSAATRRGSDGGEEVGDRQGTSGADEWHLGCV